MPFLDFTAGDVLTAANVDTMFRQGVMTFADDTARDTALTGVLAEGMYAYLTTPNYLTVYNGSAWQLVSGTGSYTPSLTNIAIGTGGSAQNSGLWWYNGGSSGGVLVVSFSIVLGTSGMSVTGIPTLTLPSGFTATATFDNKLPLGMAYLDDAAGTDWSARIQRSGTAAIALTRQVANDATISSTVPFTWAADDGIYGQASVPGSFTA